MKLYEKSSQRFVKEYANWKVSILKDMAKSFPEKEMFYKAGAVIIQEIVNKWERGLIPTDEVMKKISDF